MMEPTEGDLFDGHGESSERVVGHFVNDLL